MDDSENSEVLHIIAMDLSVSKMYVKIHTWV